jgi:ssDNA-binding Zn-finger/Zn-ribbon topoisomerase 1
MGDMADMSLDMFYTDMDEFDYYYAPPQRKKKRFFGPGPCPVCGKRTFLKEGVNGRFYGCSNYPECKGSRNYDPSLDAQEERPGKISAHVTIVTKGPVCGKTCRFLYVDRDFIETHNCLLFDVELTRENDNTLRCKKCLKKKLSS